jgi:hypothetical protein
MPEPITNIVGVATLAEFFDVDERTIQLWVTNLAAPKLAHGKYDFLKFIKWRLKYLETEIKISQSGSDRKYETEAKILELQYVERQIKVGEKLKQLAPIDLVNIIWTEETISINSALNALESDMEDIDGIHDPIKRKEKRHLAFAEMRNSISKELKIEDVEPDEEIELETEEETE